MIKNWSAAMLLHEAGASTRDRGAPISISTHSEQRWSWTAGSSLLVWCSFGQVVMGGRAGRLLTPSVLLSAWSMSVRRRSEAWER